MMGLHLPRYLVCSSRDNSDLSEHWLLSNKIAFDCFSDTSLEFLINSSSYIFNTKEKKNVLSRIQNVTDCFKV